MDNINSMIKGRKAEKKQTKAEVNFKSSNFYVTALLGAKTSLNKHDLYVYT